MGAQLASKDLADNSTCTVKCKLVTDNEGEFAGLIPVEWESPQQSREEALMFAKALIDKQPKGYKGYDPDYFELKIPGVPVGAKDQGVHCSTHNAKFMGNPLTKDQINAINACADTFTMTINLTDFKVLVGSPSNDESTGVIGYVGLLISTETLEEFNRAVDMYGGTKKEDYIGHVSICGWNIKEFATTTDARRAFALKTTDDENYPDGHKHYTKGVFPAPAHEKELIKQLGASSRKTKRLGALATEHADIAQALLAAYDLGATTRDSERATESLSRFLSTATESPASKRQKMS